MAKAAVGIAGWFLVLAAAAAGGDAGGWVTKPERGERPPPPCVDGGYAETMLKDRRKVERWEAKFDSRVPCKAFRAGKWHVAGPMDERTAEGLKNGYSKLDLGKPVKGADGKSEYRWKVLEGVRDGEAFDVGGGAFAGGAYVLAREFKRVEADPPGRVSAVLEVSMDEGAYTQWLPGRNMREEHDVLPLVRGTYKTHRLPRKAGDEWQYFIMIKPETLAASGGKFRVYWKFGYRWEDAPTGNDWARSYRRYERYAKLAEEFKDPAVKQLARWQDSENVWISEEVHRSPYATPPGLDGEFLPAMSARAARRALGRVAKMAGAEEGSEAEALKDVKVATAEWAAAQAAERAGGAAAEARFERAMAMQELLRTGVRLHTAAKAVEDHRAKFGAGYANGEKYLKEIGEMRGKCMGLAAKLRAGEAGAAGAAAGFCGEADGRLREMLLDTPFLNGRKFLVAKGQVYYNTNFDGVNRIGDELIEYDHSARSERTLHKGRLADFDLHWDGKRVLWSDMTDLWEQDFTAGGTNGPRKVTKADKGVIHYDGCYLPDGKIMSACNACWQVVPCVGNPNVGNLHVMDADGGNERRITYDQDHSWNPVVMNDGRVMFSRWEYEDTPHYFTRLLMRMNPDGTGQMELYGSNSYWPNSMFWPRPIPGNNNLFSCIVSGHHGVNREGEMYLFDVRKGRHEASGAVQKIPGAGKTIKPIIKDRLMDGIWPRYAAPYPLALGEKNVGAGEYFLVSRRFGEREPFELCLADRFDNVTPILRGYSEGNRKVSYTAAMPYEARKTPHAIPSAVDTNRTDATIYLIDIYKGDGLKGYPKGSIKSLRVGSFSYRYFGNGSTHTVGYEGGWDVKRILGTVPVTEEGSAIFKVPANTPIFVQPLDAEGKAQALMRSWYTAMPGEVGSCVGCHEAQNSIPPASMTATFRGKAPELTEWRGPARGFSFEHEIQPILNRRCVGCHDGTKEGREDFRDKRIRPEEQEAIPAHARTYLHWLGRMNPHLKTEPPHYSPSYFRLQKYVRRVGLEHDYHILPPADFEADTSHLVKMLKKGHHGVELTREEWEALYTWIDFNVPYAGRYADSGCPPNPKDRELRVKYKKLYANIDDKEEELPPLPPIGKFEAPKGKAKAAAKAVKIEVEAGGGDAKPLELAVGRLKMTLRRAPGGKMTMSDGTVKEFKAFWVAENEVSNAQFREYEPGHDSRFIDMRGKDRTSRGESQNGDALPAVRMTWTQADGFCKWLSAKTGRKVRLPDEWEWEWAARAGTTTEFAFGDKAPQYSINALGQEAARWNYGHGDAGYRDSYTFACQAGQGMRNAWGLRNMHGNVAEWTASDYADGKAGGRADAQKTVRGGSWADLPKNCGSGARWRYEGYKGIYDVGFRFVVEE